MIKWQGYVCAVFVFSVVVYMIASYFFEDDVITKRSADMIMKSPDDQVHQFGIVDYIIFSVMLGISAGTGLYHAFSGGGQKTTSKFLMADRSMYSIPVAISVLASFVSAISILGIPAEIFIHGAQYWIIVLSFLFTIPITAMVFIPVFHGLGIISAYEYLQKRFSVSVRICGSFLFLTQTAFYMAIVLYAPALALEAVTKFETWKTVLITGSICTLYTSLGGIKAVIWTDVFQFCVLFGALLTVIIMGTIHTGGMSYIWHYNSNHGHLNFFDFTVDPTARLSFWSLVIGGTFNNLSIWAVSQTAVQRFLTSKSKQEAVKSVWINLPGNIIMFTFVSFIGIILFAFYNNDMTSLLPAINSTINGSIEVSDTMVPHYTPQYNSIDQILVFFVSEEIGGVPGMQGLFVACIFAGTLSTEASGLNAMATVTFVDIIKPWREYRRHSNHSINTASMDARDTKITKILTFVFGVTSIGLAFVAAHIGSLVKSVNSVFGTAGGPLLGIFTLGILFKRANSGGVLIGLLAGFSLAVWIAVGAMVYKDPVTGDVLPDAFVLYRLSFMWYSGVGFLVTVVIGLISSEIIRCFIVDERLQVVDPGLLATFLRPKGWHQYTVIATVQDGDSDDLQIDEPMIPSLTVNTDETERNAQLLMDNDNVETVY
ncbi:sodium-dependent multivitamin transporter-like [Saccoglossus kowalevskii]